ncbi:hypothetical protein GCM10027447_15050 [Glycomyces halotolerans]
METMPSLAPRTAARSQLSRLPSADGVFPSSATTVQVNHKTGRIPPIDRWRLRAEYSTVVGVHAPEWGSSVPMTARRAPEPRREGFL